MRVLALSSLPTIGAGNRLRVEQYAPLLRSRGIQLVTSAFFDESTYKVLYSPGHTLEKALGVGRGALRRARDVLRSTTYDLAIVYRESAPLGPPVMERVFGLRRLPYVFDFDDAIYLGPVHPANARWRFLRPPGRAADSARRARVVIAGNAYLATWARHHNPRVEVLPTPVDTDVFRPLPRQPGKEVVLGWVGSTTTAPYLRLLDGPLAELATSTSFTLRVIGGVYWHDGARVDVRPYRLELEAEEVAQFDIGLLPEPDDQWSRGKGAFKAMLYMACGVPVVASRVGVNEEVIGDGGFCVDTPEEWVYAIKSLASDPALRRSMGRAGRERIEQHFALRVLAPRFGDILQRAAGMA